MRWKTDYHSDISTRMFKEEKVRELAQVEDKKFSASEDRKKVGKLYEEEYLRDSSARSPIEHSKERGVECASSFDLSQERGLSMGFLREVAKCYLCLGDGAAHC